MGQPHTCFIHIFQIHSGRVVRLVSECFGEDSEVVGDPLPLHTFVPRRCGGLRCSEGQGSMPLLIKGPPLLTWFTSLKPLSSLCGIFPNVLHKRSFSYPQPPRYSINCIVEQMVFLLLCKTGALCPTLRVLAVKMALVADTALNHHSLTHSPTLRWVQSGTKVGFGE